MKILTTFLLLSFYVIKSDAVCGLNTLLLEVKQDLADNGMLDCLRVIEPPHFVEETEDQKNLRLAAQWDTSCAFESNADWKEQIRQNLGINQLVDSVGEPVKEDFPDQADICEIIRAGLYKNIFDINNINLQKLPDDLVDKIDCSGVEGFREGPRICAATGSSYFQKDTWSIFLYPSAIKFGAIPNFIKSSNKSISSFIKSTVTKTINTSTRLVKDLMRFDVKQIQNLEGDLANMIDKAFEKTSNEEIQKGKVGKEKDDEKDKSTKARVSIKRLPETLINPNEEKKFQPLDGAVLSTDIDSPTTVFGFYMTSFKFKESKGNISFNLNFNHNEIKEARQTFGKIQESSVVSAFAQVYDNKNKKVEMKISYDSTAAGEIDIEKGEHNFSYGILTLPKSSVFKLNNQNTLTFVKSDKFSDLNDFKLSVINNNERNTHYVVMYNLAMPLNGEFNFSSRLTQDQKDLPQTTLTARSVERIGLHSATVVEISGKKTANFGIKYKYDGPKLLLEDFTDNHFTQSLTAFELPASAKIKNYKLETPTSLQTAGEWKALNLNASVSLTKKSTVFIIYNFNLKTEKAPFSLRVRFENKYTKKSVTSNTGLEYSFGTGYVIKTLNKGKYTIELDYKSSSGGAYLPANSELTDEIVNLTVIELD